MKPTLIDLKPAIDAAYELSREQCFTSASAILIFAAEHSEWEQCAITSRLSFIAVSLIHSSSEIVDHALTNLRELHYAVNRPADEDIGQICTHAGKPAEPKNSKIS